MPNKWNLEGVSVDMLNNMTIAGDLAITGDAVPSGTLTVGSGTTAISITDGALLCGTASTTYLNGTIIADALPISDPEVEGQFWNSSGTVMVSAGA